MYPVFIGTIFWKKIWKKWFLFKILPPINVFLWGRGGFFKCRLFLFVNVYSFVLHFLPNSYLCFPVSLFVLGISCFLLDKYLKKKLSFCKCLFICAPLCLFSFIPYLFPGNSIWYLIPNHFGHRNGFHKCHMVLRINFAWPKW